jgi:cellulose synthase/poly-beta-1,6-N-acetylglucosamine synthase-like glycosyltransferase
VLVTREETPDSIVSLFKQRTRWNQGFLQVYRKQDWKRLPDLRQRMLARYTLVTPFIQALSGVMILSGIAIAFLAQVNVVWAMVSFSPVIPMAATSAFEVVGLHDFGKQYELRIRFTHYVKLIIGGPFYQLILAGAALRAVWRELRGRKDWELTKHVGAHLLRDAEATS